MKKLLPLVLSLFAGVALHAQWVNDPINNTFIANTSADAGEIYLSTNAETGDTYVQWNQFFSNGWSPTLQRLNFAGEPQWGAEGIHIGAHEFSSSSEGVAMAATADGGVVSCFAIYDGYTYAVKINADGTFAWGEEGVQLFGGLGFSRAEVIAGDDGGVWALGFDYHNLYLQYVNADGTLNPTVTIQDAGGQSCMYGQLTLSYENRVFLTYEKCGNGFYTNKEIYVAGYSTDGTPFCTETRLMASQTFQVTYLHYAIPDGLGGGYVFIWHPAMGDFNVYVFHYDMNGVSTIADPNGIPVHSIDPDHLYISAYATVDPDSHDILLIYEQTDSYSQSQCKLYMNRITATGERLWGEGKLILDNGTTPCGGLRIDAFEEGGGFTVIYHRGTSMTGPESTVEAQGFDMDGNNLWNTQLCSNTYGKTGDENTTGFHGGQNIVAWVNNNTGGLYGQNIGINGEMGEVTPTPPEPCNAPESFDGRYVYDDETGTYGAFVTWTAPEGQPLHYNLYVTHPNGGTTTVEIAPEETEFFDESTVIGTVIYQLTAVYEHCESEYALTVDGSDRLSIELTSASENTDMPIVTVLKVYTLNGQAVQSAQWKHLSKGVYIVQGLTQDGTLVTQKRFVEKGL